MVNSCADSGNGNTDFHPPHFEKPRKPYCTIAYSFSKIILDYLFQPLTAYILFWRTVCNCFKVCGRKFHRSDEFNFSTIIDEFSQGISERFQSGAGKIAHCPPVFRRFP